MICFRASKAFKMEKSVTRSGKSSQSQSLSSSSSSSLSSVSSSSLSASSSSSSSRSSDLKHDEIKVVKKMDDSKGDEIKLLELYPKNTANLSKDYYRGREHGMIYACGQELYKKFPDLSTEFGEFLV